MMLPFASYIVLVLTLHRTTAFSFSGGTLLKDHSASVWRAPHRKPHPLQAIAKSVETCGAGESAGREKYARRSFLSSLVVDGGALIVSQLYIENAAATSSATSMENVLPKIKQARMQLEPIPDLIKSEKWDAVRAILITPPLSDAWSKTSKLLQKYADAVGDLPEGDEFAALEYKEEAEYHLRFLDMAVYNNVFNPIKTEGKSGATKDLIQSYYQDPVNEYNACIKVFDGLLDLSK
eukprot:CAMPEP_0194118742 /NCGR_PEP_ID=MMETSP0150-20130528/36890_1 /TAXON_ID=122233 /ORGANISM="Chaetoceros debilis, Strain MM31A-1" /LENGTH=235 /DNA_ID=CAMNT_0038810231 /DNA_START=1 /DNA_END=708 /DNA_ORIENTATION=+